MSLQGTSSGSRRGFVNLLGVLLFAAQLTACRKPTVQDLIGTWQVDYGKSTLTLKLNGDGTFEQQHQRKGESNVVQRNGKWILTNFEGPSILLTGALIVRDDTGTIESADPKGGWILHLNQTFGHVSLTVNEDLGLYFEKRQ